MSDELKLIDENIQKVTKIIETVVQSDRKDQIVAMLEDDKFGELYFTAPASSKEEYHYSFAGGLVAHSLNVYKFLRNISKMELFNFSEESMCIVALFHDLGKASASDLKSPHYVETTEDWQIQKGFNYEYNKEDLVYFPNHQRSLFILQQFGIKLKAEEYQAILLNDGQYIDSNKSFRLKEHPLALCLHMADRLALEYEKI